MSKRTCLIDECEDLAVARGLCGRHYNKERLKKTLDNWPLARRLSKNYRNIGKWTIQSDAGCLLWQGWLDAKGYARATIDGRSTLIHRFVWEQVHGPTDGLWLDHICSTPSCVEITHLRLATPSQNSQHRNKQRSDNSTGVRGVHYSAAHGAYCAMIGHLGKRYNLGYYETLEEAEFVALTKRIVLFTHNDEDRARFDEIMLEDFGRDRN